MSLKSAQLATLRAHIDSVPAWAALPNDSESALIIAGCVRWRCEPHEVTPHQSYIARAAL